MRFNPLTALEGSFRGFPFLIARDSRPGGQRGPHHEYPGRDVPYFQPLGRKAHVYRLDCYFIAVAGDPLDGGSADLQAAAFIGLLDQGKPGPLILPGLTRETVFAREWEPVMDADRAGWVQVSVVFVEAGQNQYPGAETSWPHTLMEAATAARTAFGDALGSALSVDGLPLEVTASLIGAAGTLVTVMDVAAQLTGGLAPSSVLAAAATLTGGYLGALPVAAGATLDVVSLAAATVTLLSGWSAAVANAGATQTADDLNRGVEALFTVYGEAASDSWYAVDALTPTQAAEIANQAAFSAAVRRLALAEAARLAASLTFASYDDADALRTRFADAFDDEVNLAPAANGTRETLADLQATTLLAISAAGADKAKLMPYAVPRPRTAIGLAQLFYPDDPGVAARAAELAARNGVIHPAFMPTGGERLSQ